MTTTYAYPCDMHPAEEGGFTITFPDVVEAITEGDTAAEAFVQAADALETALDVYVREGRPVPTPSPARGRPLVTLRAVVAAKLALHEALAGEGVGPAELARRLGAGKSDVTRLLDLRHPTKIGRLEEALSALGRRLTVTVRRAA